MTPDRKAASAIVGSLVFCASYAAQRLVGWATGDPIGAMLSVHVPLNWRLAIALFHAGIAVVLATLLPVERVLRARTLVWVVVLSAAGIAAWTR